MLYAPRLRLTRIPISLVLRVRHTLGTKEITAAHLPSPQRMGAAYTLARLGKQGSAAAAEALGAGLTSERESVRRAVRHPYSCNYRSWLTAATPADSPYCSCKPPAGHGLQLQTLMDSPYCSCKLTRVTQSSYWARCVLQLQSLCTVPTAAVKGGGASPPPLALKTTSLGVLGGLVC